MCVCERAHACVRECVCVRSRICEYQCLARVCVCVFELDVYTRVCVHMCVRACARAHNANANSRASVCASVQVCGWLGKHAFECLSERVCMCVCVCLFVSISTILIVSEQVCS